MRGPGRSVGAQDHAVGLRERAVDGSNTTVTARWERELPGLLALLRVPANGVVQVGAHTGQEVPALTRCGFRRLVMMEPNRDHIPRLRGQLRVHQPDANLPEPVGGYPRHEVVVAAAGRERGEAMLHVTEWDQQSSLLAPLMAVEVVRRDVCAVVPVREVQHGCNVLVIDAQGAEIDVLAGADLRRLDLAVIEGSTRARYENGSTVDSIAVFMRAHGWRQVATWAHVRPDVYDVAWLSPRSGDGQPHAVTR